MANFTIDDRLLIRRGTDSQKVHRVDLSGWIRDGWQIVPTQLVVGTNNDYEGQGSPVAPPNDLANPASYLDTLAQESYTWSPSLGTWINTSTASSSGSQFSIGSGDPTSPPSNTAIYGGYFDQASDTPWFWDVGEQAWKKGSSGSGEGITGAGAPTSPPPDTTKSINYFDTVNNYLYNWDVTDQEWVLIGVEQDLEGLGAPTSNPPDTNKSARYFDSRNDIYYNWDIADQTWVRITYEPPASQNAEGSTDPTVPPNDPTKPATYWNTVTNRKFQWDVTNQVWVLIAAAVAIPLSSATAAALGVTTVDAAIAKNNQLIIDQDPDKRIARIAPASLPNPLPAADKGEYFLFNAAGTITVNSIAYEVEERDWLWCNQDGTAAGDEANWEVITSPGATTIQPPHFRSLSPSKIPVGLPSKIKIFGSFFIPEPEFTVTSEDVAVNSINFISDNEIEVEIVAQNSGNFDLTFNNGLETTVNGAIEVFEPLLWDLREGLNQSYQATSYTSTTQNGDWLNVFATGSSWRGSIRFLGSGNQYRWSRTQSKSLSWILFPQSMIGLGSTEVSVSAATQYSQMELMVYLDGGLVRGLYSNSGTPGSSASQSLSENLQGAEIVKVTITKNGEAGGKWTIYDLTPDDAGLESSGLERDDFLSRNLTVDKWFAIDRPVSSGVIPSNIGADAELIMPAVVLRAGVNMRLIGFYLEDE